MPAAVASATAYIVVRYALPQAVISIVPHLYADDGDVYGGVRHCRKHLFPCRALDTVSWTA